MTSSIEPVRWCRNTAGVDVIRRHLSECSAGFTPALDSRVSIDAYAAKLHSHAERFEAWSGCTLSGLVAMYCNGPRDQGAFISSVSVVQASRRLGLASTLLGQALDLADALGFPIVRLEVAAAETGAADLYARFGFRCDGSARSDGFRRLVLRLPRRTAPWDG